MGLMELEETLPIDHLECFSNLGVREMEKQMIVRALIKYLGNQKRAAEYLKIPKSTLHDKIKNFGINLQIIKNGSTRVS